MIGCVIVSDRGDLYLPATRAALEPLLGDMPIRIVDDSDHRLGLAGAARAAWQIAMDEGWDYLLHWEEDFLPVAPLPLSDMQHILDHFPHVTQVVLKRQPWSPEEKAAGGIVEMHPQEYEEVDVSAVRADVSYSYQMTLHRRIFSLNPCLIPRRTFQWGWPDSNEAGMTALLNENPANRFAFYGGKLDPPLVEHVGQTRGQGWAL